MQRALLFLVFSILLVGPIQGQIKIGDNPQNIDPSSVLELESNSRVLVITRVSTVEMNAITPLPGAVVYNTDLQCVHYYDGAQWVNICEEVGGIPNLTTDPFVNANSTLVITPNGENNHIEVAPNSIRSAQIVDGGINGVDIQDNSIGQSKIGNDAVGRNEIAENAVGLEALDTDEVTLGTLTNTPGFITGADIVSSAPNNALTDNSGAFYDNTPVLDAISANSGNITTNTSAISTNATAISDHITNDGDLDDRNELTDLSFDSGSNILSLTRSDTGITVDLSGLNNSGSDSQNLTLVGNTLGIDNGNSVNLAGFLDNTDEQQLSINPAGTRISLTDGGFVDLPPGTVDTDEQQLTLAGNILTLEDGGAPISLLPYLDNTDEQQLSIAGNRISLTDGGFVDLPAGTVDTDEQQLTLAGNILTLENGGAPISLVPYLDNTDEQTISDFTFNDTNNILSITIDGGNTETADLSSLAGGGTQDLTSVLTQGNNAGANSILNLVDSADPTSAATRGYVDANLGGSQDLASVLGNGSSAGSSQINDLLDPTLPQDAATQNYVETRIATILASGGVDGVVSNAFLSGTEIDFIGTNGGFNGTVDLDPVFATNAELAADISSSEALDLDKDLTNEIQTLSILGSDLSLSNGGGTVTIPSSADGVVSNVTASANGFDVTGANGGFNGSVDLDPVFATDAQLAAAITASEALDNDTSITNEIQALSILGSDLTLSNGGGTVTIPAGTNDGVVSNVTASANGFDVTGANGGFNGSVDLDPVFATDAQLAAAITASEALDNDTSITNEIQALSILGSDLTLSNGGGTVTIPAGTNDGVVSNVTASANGFDVTGANGGFNGSVDLDPVFATDAQLAAAITASEALDNDTSITNEIQALSILGSDLTLSNGGGTVTIPAGTNDGVVSNMTASANGFDVTGANGGFNGSVDLDPVFATDAQLAAAITASEALDNDTSITNEIQALSILGSDLTLSNGGGTVTIPAGTNDGVVSNVTASANGFDVTGANGGFNGSVDLDPVFATDAQLAAAITASEALDNDTSITNEIQALSILGSDLTLSNGGGTVTIPAGTNDGVVSNVTASANGFDVTGANGGFNGSVDLDPVFATDAQLAAAITASEALDNDTNNTNEIPDHLIP